MRMSPDSWVNAKTRPKSGVKRLGLGTLTAMDWRTRMRRLQVPLADRLKE